KGLGWPPKKKGRSIQQGAIDRQLRNTAALRNWLGSMENTEKEQGRDEADYFLSYVKTQHGYQVYLLFEELSPNCEIFHRDSWRGIKRNVGSILSKGRQVQGELAAILKKFFFEIDLKGNNAEKAEQKQVINIKSTESPKTEQITSKIPYKLLKLENILITSKQATKRANHYRVNYLDKWQNPGFFFMDGYFRDKKELIQPNLVVVFPPQEEFERVVRRVSKSEKRTNIGLPPNASSEEKAKYKFCKT
ncbi:25858_t:CDS:2, partial [Racocetra persica]